LLFFSFSGTEFFQKVTKKYKGEFKRKISLLSKKVYICLTVRQISQTGT